jgi:hypothetical protein
MKPTTKRRAIAVQHAEICITIDFNGILTLSPSGGWYDGQDEALAERASWQALW